MKFAVQMYSLREAVAERGMRAVLKLVRDAGYQGVEFAGFGDLSPEQAKDAASCLGLETMGAHIGIAELLDTERAMELIRLFGFETVTVPALDMTDRQDNGATAVPKFRQAVKTLGSFARVCYHNHNFEFTSKGDTVKNLLKKVPGLFAELDVFWLVDSGFDPVAYMRELGGRVGLLHMKEMGAGGREDYNPIIGHGISRSGEVLVCGAELGVPWAILETERVREDTEYYLSESRKAMEGFLRRT